MAEKIEGLCVPSAGQKNLETSPGMSNSTLTKKKNSIKHYYIKMQSLHSVYIALYSKHTIY